MAEMEVLILVRECKRGELESIARTLEAQGLQIKQTFPRFRTIVGTADSAAVSGMKAVDGVESVRPQARFELPPMDDKTPR